MVDATNAAVRPFVALADVVIDPLRRGRSFEMRRGSVHFDRTPALEASGGRWHWTPARRPASPSHTASNAEQPALSDWMDGGELRARESVAWVTT